MTKLTDVLQINEDSSKFRSHLTITTHSYKSYKSHKSHKYVINTLNNSYNNDW
jgi:hypothetical protein